MNIRCPQAVNRHLDILRPAIANYGGSVDVLAVDGEGCLVKYPDITNVVFPQN
jgi:hypothetical protein